MLSLFVVCCAVPLVGCQSTDAPKPAPPNTISVSDGSARVVGGRPCRATVQGIELLVGIDPLVAQVGADKWTGEDAANGLTVRKNDQIVARIHAKQLFDANGIPLMRVLDSGEIVDKSNAVVRKAFTGTNHVQIDSLTVTGTTDVAIAAMLTARETVPEVRALAACHYLIESH